MTIGTPAPRGEVVEEHGARFEVFALPADEASLLEILKDCFKEWEHIHMGPLIPGALWEIRPPCEPDISLADGYATVDFKDWHFHLCIGKPRGASLEMTEMRRTNRVELYRRLNQEEAPIWWRLRFLNGAGDQQLTFMLPRPFPADQQRLEDEPTPGGLGLWDHLLLKSVASEPGNAGHPFHGMLHD